MSEKPKRVSYGFVSLEMVRRLTELNNMQERFDEQLNARKAELRETLRLKLKAEFHPRAEAIMKEHDAIWDEIVKLFNISPESPVQVDQRTGEVYRDPDQMEFAVDEGPLSGVKIIEITPEMVENLLARAPRKDPSTVH